MRKLLLSLAAVALGLGTMNAAGPEWSISGDIKAEINKGSVRKAKAQDASSEWQCAYFMGSDVEAIGLKSEATVKAAIVIPEELASQCVGSRITSIYFLMGNSIDNSGRVFITDGLEGATIWEKNVELNLGTIKGNTFNAAENEINLEEPYVFDGKAIAVGYEIKAPASTEKKPYSPLCFVYETPISNDGNNVCIETPQGSSWTNLEYGPWTIVVTVEGENLPTWGLVTGYDMPYITKPGEKVSVQFEITNMGGKAITKVKGYSTVGGVAGEIQEVQADIAPGRNGTVEIKSPVIDKNGIYTIGGALTELNGLSLDGVDVSDFVKCIDKGFPRRVVVEEWTGTWCGWCPRGIWGMDYMKEKYPDEFIGIAIHSSNGWQQKDPFNLSSYIQSLASNGLASSFPGSWVDRMAVVFPGPDAFESVLNALGTDTGFADISLEASYTDETEKTLEIKTITKVGYDAAEVNDVLANSKYRIAFVIIENNLPGKQTNYYSGGNAGQCGGWESMKSSAEWNFDDVARVIDVFNGINGSVPDKLEKDKEYEFVHNITLPKTIVKKNNIDIIALLINTTDGHIENAAKIHGPMAVTAIDSVGADAEGNVAVSAADGGITVVGDCAEAEVYGLNGVRVASLHGCGTVEVTAGLYIVRTVAAAGTVSAVKVAVR